MRFDGLRNLCKNLVMQIWVNVKRVDSSENQVDALYSAAEAHATKTGNSPRQQAGISCNPRPKPACSPKSYQISVISVSHARAL